jgi:hypothetical protein
MALTTTVWFAGPNRVQSSTSASTSDEERTFKVELFKPVSGHLIEDSDPLFNPDFLFFLMEGDGRGNSSRFVMVKLDGESVVDFERERERVTVGGVLKRSKENG